MTDIAITGWTQYTVSATYNCYNGGSINVSSNDVDITPYSQYVYTCARVTSVDLTCCNTLKFTLSHGYDSTQAVRVWIGGTALYPGTTAGAKEVTVPVGSRTTGQTIIISWSSGGSVVGSFDDIMSDFR